MAVQISMQGFHSSPRLAPPIHPFFPPPNIVSSAAMDPGLQALPVSPATSAPKPAATATNPTSSGGAGASSTASASGGQATGSSFDGRRMRSKTAIRRTVDYNSSVANWIQNRIWQRDQRDMRVIQPEAIYTPMMVPPGMLLGNPVNSLATRSVRVAMNKVKCPIFCTCWTPEGRRLVTGASSGEFTLWNGLTFSFETILQAHDTSVRAMVWSHNDTWMLTADHGGYVKYWQSNMNNVKMYQAHKDPIRGLRWASAKSVKHCQNHSDICRTLLQLPENMFLLTVSLVTLSTVVEYNRILTLFMIICFWLLSSSDLLMKTRLRVPDRN